MIGPRHRGPVPIAYDDGGPVRGASGAQLGGGHRGLRAQPQLQPPAGTQPQAGDRETRGRPHGIQVQGESKKSVISKNMALTTLKSIRKGKSWCVLENSA